MRFFISLVLAAVNCGFGMPQNSSQPTPQNSGGAVSINVHGAMLADVVGMLAKQSGRNIIVAPGAAEQRVVLTLEHVPIATALLALERAYGLVELHSGPVTVLALANGVNGVLSSKIIQVPIGGAAQLAIFAQARYGSSVVVSAADATTAIVAGPPDAIDQIAHIAEELSKGDFSVERIGTKTDPKLVIGQMTSLGIITASMPIYPDETNSAIIISGTSAARTALRNIIPTLDVMGKQVLFTVQILDVQPANDTFNLGTVIGSPTIGSSGSGTGQITITPGSVTALGGPGVLHGIPFGVQLNANATNGSARVLATPQIAVLNNGTGNLQLGSNYPIAATNGGLVGGQTVQFYKIGILLTITASINKDNTVTTALSATESDIAGFDPTSGLPIIATDTAQSQVRVNDGDSIVLAHFFRNSDSRTVSKIPGLGDLPILGGFFRNRALTHQKDEIDFIITPHVGDIHQELNKEQ
jgi:type II secretory pathway component GspD/PulD (secretin)